MSPSDAELYRRAERTLVASWEAFARAATDAQVHVAPGVIAAVFPRQPERGIYNNALLERELQSDQRSRALDQMEALYAAAGVTRFAAWVHEHDYAMRAAIEARGYQFDSATRAMAMELTDVPRVRARIEPVQIGWRDHLRMFGLAPDLLAGGVDEASFRILGARVEGANVACAIAFDHEGDCGIYNVGTLEPFRRRGLAAALTAQQLHDATVRGCSTASVQATPMAERIYASVGFRDLGRYFEYVPQ
jgi:GNAT superfamily N-acetyltransferase